MTASLFLCLLSNLIKSTSYMLLACSLHFLADTTLFFYKKLRSRVSFESFLKIQLFSPESFSLYICQHYIPSSLPRGGGGGGGGLHIFF